MEEKKCEICGKNMVNDKEWGSLIEFDVGEILQYHEYLCFECFVKTRKTLIALTKERNL